MPAFKFQLQGFSPAFADSIVKLINVATGAVVERKPFLDGSLTLGDLDPGPYELEVKHPNLISPVYRRKIRLFPQIPPTFVPVPIDPGLFKDSPIRDVPDADLTPVQQAARAAQDKLARIGDKQPGEAIRAADWNAMASALGDVAGAVIELTHRLSPVGHAHPEIAEKIDEVQGNLRRFSESFGKSLLALQRQIEQENLTRAADEVFAGASEEIRRRVHARIEELKPVIEADPRVFSKRLATTGDTILTAVADAASAAGAGADAFLSRPEVKALQRAAANYREAGVIDAPDSEIKLYQRNMQHFALNT